MKITFAIVVGLLAMATPIAHATEGKRPSFSYCASYGGHIDVEGKVGERPIGETFIFVPISCDDNTLFFTDIRVKGDTSSNREANFGLGVRELTEKGVAGGYAYFDRKKSGVSDKFHSQATAGAEWLTEELEFRGNVYVPLTGEVMVNNGIASVSDPYLGGSGLYVGERDLILRESPLYGGDLEAGASLPGLPRPLWLYAGVYAFNGEDADGMTGARLRARLDLFKYFSVSAEGQYDDERGRMGWLGGRLSIPLGGPKGGHIGLKAKMNASPVRDIDIVTSQAQAPSPIREVAINNTESGTAQRIIYVDNTAAGGGDGSKDSPFNTLAAAQAVLQDHDILYIHGGSGTTGMASGLTLSQQGVQVIGAGSALTFDSGRYEASNGRNLSSKAGVTLLASGTAPTLTNGSGDGITVTGDNVLIAGVTVSGTSDDGIQVTNVDGFTLRNATVSYAGSNGVEFTGSGVSGTYTFENNVIGNNETYGIDMTLNGAARATVNVNNNTMNYNEDQGLYMMLAGTAHISTTIGYNTINHTNLADSASAANGNAIYMRGQESAKIDFDIVSNTIHDTKGSGIMVVGENATDVDFNGYIRRNDVVDVQTGAGFENLGIRVDMYANTTLGSASNRFIMDGNNLENATEDGIKVWAQDGTIYAHFTSNTATGADDGMGARTLGAGFVDVIFENNTSNGNREVGIQLDTRESSGTLLAEVRNNVTNNNSVRGIQIGILDGMGSYTGTSATPIIVENNTMNNNTQNGIYIAAEEGVGETHAIIRNNTIASNGVTGITIKASETGVVGIEVASNNITSSGGIGLEAESYASSTLTGLYRSNTIISSGAQGINMGAYNSSTHVLQIVGNTVSSSAQDGIELNARQWALITGKINDNDVVSSGENGIYITARDTSGTIGLASAPFEISGNTVIGSSLSGMHIRSQSGSDPYVRVKVQGNTVYNNTQRGIEFNEFDSTGGTQNLFADLGGGAYGSAGYNSIYNNGGVNLYYGSIDVAGLTWKAENNWWGQDADPTGFDEAYDSDGANEATVVNGGTIDASPRHSAAP